MTESVFLNRAGDKYNDFVTTKVVAIPELNCTLRELTHLPTGASVMHIDNDDPENLFCLSFQTLPSNSNGVAHILEHTVLCGSEKFPIKDPFFSMSRRSLNTFMNALTGSDFTCYPAASLNEKDFYNLLEVYIDAVFHPELKRMSFFQEGHRLEFIQPDDPATPLVYKGIVFNEMKGSLSSPDTRMWHAMMERLIPDLPYAYNSGGDPREIPNLTYAELVNFHETFYHPSHCLFFFYGNIPLKQHLDFIAEKALKNVTPAPPLPPIPLQKRFTKPVQEKMRYPINEADSTEQRTIISFGFLTAPLIDQEEVLALSVLDSVLMETDASVLKKALLKSKLCIQADGFMDAEMSEVPYVIVCKGCDAHNADQLEETLLQALSQVIEKGIPQDQIDAAIHQLEFSRLEISGDHAPFGLTLFMRSALAKQHGCDPEDALALQTLFEGLLAKVKDPTYLPGLIKKYFLSNPHRVRLTMVPDPHLSAEEIAQEKQALQEIHDHLNETKTQLILSQTQELIEFQKKTEEQSLDCLPKVTLEDVSTIARDFPLKHTHTGNLDVYHHDCFTNHIVYADLIFDIPEIADEDLSLIHLMTTLIPEIGSGTRNYAQNLDYLQAHTGGIGAACALHIQMSDPKVAKPSFTLRGKALYRKADKLFSLMRDTITRPRFDEAKRIEELILQIRDSQLNRLNRQAMRYATHLALSGFSSASYVNEAWYGIRYFKAIEELSNDLTHNISPLIDRMLAQKETLMSLHQPQLVLSCSRQMYHALEQSNFYGLTDLPAPTQFKPWKLDYPLQTTPSQFRTISSQVAFTAEAYTTISYLHPHSPALIVASQLLDHKILHRKIREQGGAYGCGATYGSTLGQFVFHSYRDPHIASTLSTFQESIDVIANGEFNDQDLEEAKLGIIQQFDIPISPASRAITAYAWLRDGKSHAMRQQFRERLLALTHKDIVNAVEMHLLPLKGKGVVVSFAGKDQCEREHTHLPQIPILSI